MTDKINLLYLATLGKGINATYKYAEVKPYIDYIKALIASKSNVKTVKSTYQPSYNNNFNNSIQFFSNYQANINNGSINTSLEENEMLDLLDRIKSADFAKNTFELTDKQYDFIFGKNSSTSLPKNLSSLTSVELMLLYLGSENSRMVSTPPNCLLMSACSLSYSKSLAERTPRTRNLAPIRCAKSMVRSS